MGRKDNEEDSPIADTALKSLAGAGAGALGGIIGLVVAGPMGAVAGGVAGSAIAPMVEKLALTRGCARRSDAGRVGSYGSSSFGIATKYGRGLARTVIDDLLHVRTLLIQSLVGAY